MLTDAPPLASSVGVTDTYQFAPPSSENITLVFEAYI